MTHPYTDLKEAAERAVNHSEGGMTVRPKIVLSLLADYERMKEALESIESLLSEEITTRFGGDAQISEEQMGANSRIYSLLVVPRNIARAALKKKPHD